MSPTREATAVGVMSATRTRAGRRPGLMGDFQKFTVFGSVSVRIKVDDRKVHLSPCSEGRCACRNPRRLQDAGSYWKTRNSWSHRQAFAMRAAQTTASAREGSSRTVKPPSSEGAHG
jgi:hypothetical protein